MQAHRLEAILEERADELAKLAGRIALVAGGPPCQGFSSAGRRTHGDPRNAMVDQYLAFLSIVKPRLVLVENVRGFTTMARTSEETYADYIARELRDRGYKVWSKLVVASEWGVPQRRPRYLVIAAQGVPDGVDPFLRMRVARRSFLEKRGLPADREVTTAEAIGDLAVNGVELVPCRDGGQAGFDQIRYEQPSKLNPYLALMRDGAAGMPNGLRLPRHEPATQARFRSIIETCHPGRPLSVPDRKRFGMLKRSLTPLAADQPSCTVTTLPDDMLHYAEPRILTVRECARLQSFPDTYVLEGPYTTGGPQRASACPRYTQVGNAVPPLLAEAVGETLLGLAGLPERVHQRVDRVELACKALAEVG